jgi:Predicted Rossmann fold nucleotide-binding protein involved in DNA uptake
MAYNERIYLIGLTMLKGVGDVLSRALLQYFGSAEDVFKAKRQILEKVPGIGEYTANNIYEEKTSALQRAEKELAFVDKNNIHLFAITDNDYPGRLRECQDAPTVFYYKGNANINAARILSVVGTRRSTGYGRELTESLIKDLAETFSRLDYCKRTCLRHRCLRRIVQR